MTDQVSEIAGHTCFPKKQNKTEDKIVFHPVHTNTGTIYINNLVIATVLWHTKWYN